MNKKDVPIDTLFTIPFVSATKQQVIDFVVSQVEKKNQNDEKKGITTIFTPNPEQVTLALHNPSFLHILQSSTCNLPDGQGVVWALKRSQKYPYVRIPGREVFHDLLLLSRKEKWRVFLLGGKPGSAKAIAASFQYDEGALDIAHETREEEERILRKIEAYKPQLLFVAYGAPWQERWIIEHEKQLAASGVRVAMVVGGAFEYEAGKVPQVPALMENLHLEWLWRLLMEPCRWKRQLRGLEFFWRVLTEAM